MNEQPICCESCGRTVLVVPSSAVENLQTEDEYLLFCGHVCLWEYVDRKQTDALLDFFSK